MEFEDFEEEEMERQLPVARHEFGHYTVARFLGFEAEDVKLAAKATLGGVAGTAGLKLLHPLITSDDILKYCESRIKILFAGVLAEALENGVIKNDNAILYPETTGSQDHGKARELLQIARGILHPSTKEEKTANEELKSLSDRLWSEAGGIVEEYSDFIEGMALEIVKKDVRSFEGATFTGADLSAHPLVQRTFGA